MTITTLTIRSDPAFDIQEKNYNPDGSTMEETQKKTQYFM